MVANNLRTIRHILTQALLHTVVIRERLRSRFSANIWHTSISNIGSKPLYANTLGIPALAPLAALTSENAQGWSDTSWTLKSGPRGGPHLASLSFLLQIQRLCLTTFSQGWKPGTLKWHVALESKATSKGLPLSLVTAPSIVAHHSQFAMTTKCQFFRGAMPLGL